MERTKEQWQAIGRVLAHGIYPGCMVRDPWGDGGHVPGVDVWHVERNKSVGFSMNQGGCVLWSASKNLYATVIDPPQPLSGKEVSVTIDGQTYTAIIK